MASRTSGKTFSHHIPVSAAALVGNISTHLENMSTITKQYFFPSRGVNSTTSPYIVGDTHNTFGTKTKNFVHSLKILLYTSAGQCYLPYPPLTYGLYHVS